MADDHQGGGGGGGDQPKVSGCYKWTVVIMGGIFFVINMIDAIMKLVDHNWGSGVGKILLVAVYALGIYAAFAENPKFLSITLVLVIIIAVANVVVDVVYLVIFHTNKGT